MITAADRFLLGRARWSLEELIHIAFMARMLVSTLDGLLGVRLTQVPIAPGEEQPSSPGAPTVEPASTLPIPRRAASALRAVDALRTREELLLIAARIRERLGAA